MAFFGGMRPGQLDVIEGIFGRNEWKNATLYIKMYWNKYSGLGHCKPITDLKPANQKP